MNIHSPSSQTATIYQFPVGGRAGLNASRNNVRPFGEMMPRAGSLASADAWYHQVAIQQEAADNDRTKGKQ